MLNLIHHEPDIDKIYLHAKDPYESKLSIFYYQKWESRLKEHYNVLKAFTDYSNHIQDVYKNIDEYNPGKESINRTW